MTRGIGVLVVLAIVLVYSGTVAALEYGNPELLVDTAFVKKYKDQPGWVLLDVRDEKAYAKGHIPGAINLGKRADKALRDPSATMLPVEKLEQVLGDAGISDSSNIIIYYDPATITRAGVAFHVLEVLGCNSDRLSCKVYWYNGGIVSWTQDGGELTTEPKTLPKTTFKASPIWERYATTDEIYYIATGEKPDKALDEMTKRYGAEIVTYDPDAQLVDLRTADEYNGKDIRALRGGHVPNVALHVSHVELYDPKTGKIKSMEELEKLLGSLDKSKRVIGYCQTGTRSSFGYFIFRLMGFENPANWDESWRVWGSNVNYPVENEQWYNFASIRSSKVKSFSAAAGKADAALKETQELKQEVESLKAELERVKAEKGSSSGGGVCAPTLVVLLALLPLAGYLALRRRWKL